MKPKISGKQFFEVITSKALPAATHQAMHHASRAEGRATTLDEIVATLSVAKREGASVADVLGYIEGIRDKAVVEHVDRVHALQAQLGVKII